MLLTPEERAKRLDTARGITGTIQGPAVCFHEAGHAVAAYKQGLTVVKANVKSGVGFGGFVGWGGDLEEGNPPDARTVARVCYAGKEAQLIYAPKSYEAETDSQDIQMADKWLEGAGIQVEGIRLREESRELVRDNWELVKRLATWFGRTGALTEEELNNILTNKV
jgi:hypothetical protein